MKWKLSWFFLLACFPVTGPAQSLEIANLPASGFFRPLETVALEIRGTGRLEVYDAAGKMYYRTVAGRATSFPAGGALGAQSALLLDDDGKLLDRLTFRVDGDTRIEDDGGRYHRLLNVLYHSMVGEWGQETDVVFLNDKFYYFFVRWLRDHVHTMKGMKYFYPRLKEGIDLYADTQREDGMIWDNIYPRGKEKNWWDKRFRYGDFIREVEGGRLELKRIPVENDVEYLFIEGLYYTWKATGDDAWMQGRLDQALQALNYSFTDPYRWSEKYQLLKRGFTIDTWDFQAQEDAEIAGNDIMVVIPGKTRFGIMFGDNTGMAAACTYLAEMLRHAGRKEEAEKVAATGRDLQRRVDELAWTGDHYLHHVPEDPALVRDLGVDQSQQVSLSNAYSLNRGLTHEQCAAIIRTYQRIRKEMPATSAGEWYAIFPPFERGFGKNDSSSKWEYMNGGVTSIVAGELARGAFEHGFEDYGVDILNRVLGLAEETDGYLHCTYRGAMPAEPEREFTPIDLAPVANTDFPGAAATYQGAPLRKATNSEFHGVPFRLNNGEQNALQLSKDHPSASLGIGEQAGAIYLLHELSPGSTATPSFTLHYQDGTTHTDYMTSDKGGNWWHEPAGGDRNDHCRKAWRSDNDRYVALYLYGLNNPFPEKTIDSLTFAATLDGRTWSIAGITLSKEPVFFMPSRVSHGIPDNWGAAAVVYALVEGLAGVVDSGVAFDTTTIAPRWPAAGIDRAEVMIKYPASDGYAGYRYRHDPTTRTIDLEITGNADQYLLRVLLPEGTKVSRATINGREAAVRSENIEQSAYAVLDLTGRGVFSVRVEY